MRRLGGLILERVDLPSAFAQPLPKLVTVEAPDTGKRSLVDIFRASPAVFRPWQTFGQTVF